MYCNNRYRLLIYTGLGIIKSIDRCRGVSELMNEWIALPEALGPVELFVDVVMY